MKCWRQGDIILKQVDDIEVTKEKKDGILAEGEATGHAHRIAQQNAATLYYTPCTEF